MTTTSPNNPAEVPGTLPPPFATGHSAELFHLSTDKVLKLFRADIPEQIVEIEQAKSQVVHQLGVRTPAAESIVQHSGRFGIIFPRVDSPTLLEVLLQNPGRCEELAIAFADAHAQIHQHRTDNLPPQRVRLQSFIQNAAISSEILDGALNQLNALPDENFVCHEDFHPGNALATAEGVQAIDWLSATTGNAAADVAKSRWVIRHTEAHGLPQELQEVVASLHSMFEQIYVTAWCERSHMKMELVDKWMLPVGVAMLGEPRGEGVIRAIIKELPGYV